MHGTTMIFLVVMPIGAAFMNYLLPLQIGARDVAFPRLNALSFWSSSSAASSSTLVAARRRRRRRLVQLRPEQRRVFSPTHGIDFWNMGLLITGIASLVGAVNLITTVLNMRAPGMTLMKMPVFTWMTLVTQFLLLFAIPVITVAQFLLMFDRLFGAQFFDVEPGRRPAAVGAPVLDLRSPRGLHHDPAGFGVISEIIPVFSRKPIFGYPFMVFSGIAIGFMGWGVWAHHMFASGMGPISVAAFSVATMFIAVPTGVKILNWLATMWGGKLKFTSPMLFSIGLVTMFTIGGLSGVTHAVAPADTQQTDTYYIVAHFHYVLFGGALFGLHRRLVLLVAQGLRLQARRALGKINFWVLLLGFNLTFGPMHILGLQGMPRRTYTYRDGYGFNFWNLVSTVGAFMIAVSFLIFFVNIARATGAPPSNPWCPGRPVGRPQPRVDDPEPHAGAQLRRHPHRHRARRVLAPQVRRGRGRPPGAHRRHRGRRPEGRRHRRAPAVAVVLAHRAGLRHALVGLRPDLQPVVGLLGGVLVVAGHLRLGHGALHRSRRRPRP
jgi:cytochrome c oxidase subunit 1